MTLKAVWMSVALLCLVGCGPDSNDSTDSVSLRFSSPAGVLRSIDPAVLTLSVLIDGISQEVVPNASGSVWSGMFTLPTDRGVELLINWEHMGFPIARYRSNVGPITSSTTLSVDSGDYDTTGEGFDADSDGISNLQELTNNTNPSDELNIDVRIPRVPAAPGINGTTGIVWADNIIFDWQDEPLAIDNLMIDLGATRPDGDTGFYWQAVHNGELLFIIVYAEDAANETPHADSTSHMRDDAINIFIDGDNSKLESYDALNDFHIIIPFAKLRRSASSDMAAIPATDVNGDLSVADEMLAVTTENGTTLVPAANLETNTNNDVIGDDTTGARLSYGPPSVQPLDSILFATGRPGEGSGQPQQVYEVQISLEQLGITLGSPFGIEIQVDTDDDGGNRDARYGWKHPSKESNGSDVDNTVTNPKFMGTAVLQ